MVETKAGVTPGYVARAESSNAMHAEHMVDGVDRLGWEACWCCMGDPECIGSFPFS